MQWAHCGKAWAERDGWLITLTSCNPPSICVPQAAGAAAGVAAEQAQIRVKQAGKVPDEGPPTESLAMVVETVLSRQGRVDLIVSCPIGR